MCVTDCHMTLAVKVALNPQYNQPITTQSWLLTTLYIRNLLVTSIFPFSHNVFSSSQNKFHFFCHINFVSAVAFHLDQSKILSFGKELNVAWFMRLGLPNRKYFLEKERMVTNVFSFSYSVLSLFFFPIQRICKNRMSALWWVNE